MRHILLALLAFLWCGGVAFGATEVTDLSAQPITVYGEADTYGDVDTMITTSTHAGRTDNPHSVTENVPTALSAADFCVDGVNRDAALTVTNPREYDGICCRTKVGATSGTVFWCESLDGSTAWL